MKSVAPVEATPVRNVRRFRASLHRRRSPAKATRFIGRLTTARAKAADHYAPGSRRPRLSFPASEAKESNMPKQLLRRACRRCCRPAQEQQRDRDLSVSAARPHMSARGHRVLDERTHTKHGKWSQPGVPHRGWHCVDVEDFGEPSQLCQMCEGVDIRYVHRMQHPDYPDVLAVGCVCAEHMEEDYAGPRRREEHLRSAARRRASWARRGWNLSAKGELLSQCRGLQHHYLPLRPPLQGRRKEPRNRSIAVGRSKSTTRLTPRRWARSTNYSWRRRTSAEEKASRRAKIDAF